MDLNAIAFDAAPIGIVMTHNRNITTCNRTFAAMLGYAPADLTGQSFRLFYGSDEEFQRIRDIGLTTLQNGGHYTDQRLLRHHDGHAIWCRFRAATLTPNAPLDQLVMSLARIPDTKPEVTLTRRERQVLGLMNQLMTSKEIARELGVSPRTIDDVRGRLIKRFGVKRAADLLDRLAQPSP